ncbi:hypothetical protein HOP62_16625 [Halomonas sp. MCCC 1A17488]|uniref:hypothetical protein n=1 Tax=unclassified Halomonas TaxID=2609666 RepID=UPI0018D24EEE|nr:MULTISPECIES: hypothetical protein [unclassified Halomonas]MCE8017705.1 hypothetical protein [Halomonas sp. MCCC 1A17488]MCG3241038.1 hypothetical protein [Halomonas sp. MCCC 1A17488]QPP48900.1 hypothetical protein I4484_17075 [Halomonas sp. SS10-MC5]
MSRKMGVDSAIFLAAFTALLYTWSTAYYHGYIGVLNLNADMMERNFHQIIYDGFLISFAPVLVILIISAMCLWAYSHAVLPSYTDWLKSSVGRKRKVVRVRRLFFGCRGETVLELRAKSSTVKAALFAFAGIFYIVSLGFFDREGKVRAEEFLSVIASEDHHYSRVINAQVGGEIKKLIFIRCGVRNCAGLEKNEGVIYYFDSSSGYSFTYALPKEVEVAAAD